jgi:hypothetical protein
MFQKASLYVFILILGIIYFIIIDTAFSFVERKGSKTYIVDRTGKRWDVTQAESIGFIPEGFQYGLGKDAFTPLDDSSLSDETANVPQNLRILGIKEGSQAQAYSIPRLTGHEIANSRIGSKPIAVGF